jgi:glycosyltransferase involved in cell wall biosynthesis
MNGINCTPLVVGNCIDESVFFINKGEKDVFNILVVTYPSYIKDNETLFNAIKVLKLQGITDFKVLIIGGDFDNLYLTDKNNPLFKQAESFGILEYLEFLNYVNREEMPGYYNKSDVFVSTSIAETFGVAQCEAMMCGVPVIATANGGIDDMISEKNGIKIPIQDYKALAKAILQIKNKEVQFKPDEIRNSVIGKFGKDAFKNKLLEVYSKF